MLTLSTAVKLKAAGLKWEPDRYDLFTDDHQLTGVYSNPDEYVNKNKYEFIWLPRLENLLAEIEGAGWLWDMRQLDAKVYSKKYICFATKYGTADMVDAAADNPTEAAAQSLIWILENQRGDGE